MGARTTVNSSIAAGCAVGVDIEDIFAFRQVLLREGHDLLGKSAVIDAGSKTDAIIARQIRIRLGNDIDQGDVVFCGDGVQKFLCVAVMLGIVGDSGLHADDLLNHRCDRNRK